MVARLRWLLLLCAVGCNASVDVEDGDESTVLRALDVQWVDGGVGTDCMPVVPPDAAFVFARLRFVNGSSEPAEWIALGAEVRSDEGAVRRFDLDPPSSGWVGPGETVELSFSNLVGTGEGDAACMFCQQEGSLRIFWSTPEGDVVTHAEVGEIGCTS